MMSTALIDDDRFLDHDTGPGHPERADRLRAVLRGLRSDPVWERLIRIAPRVAGLEWVRGVHDAGYVDRVRRDCEDGRGWIDTPESRICPASYEVALLAGGAVTRAVDAVIDQESAPREADRVFCAVRPPGHHAESDRSMGFCLFNNIAIGVEYAIAHHGIKRVGIVDFDVHHGNGTQHLFERRDDVLFISLHQDPTTLYPGSGFASEIGIGNGEGFTLNIPLPPGSGDDDYRAAFETRVVPRLEQFMPELLFVSAGFDGAAGDPLAQMELTPDGYAWMTRQLTWVAEKHCDNRVISVLEGGYDLASLADCVCAHVNVLAE